MSSPGITVDNVFGIPNWTQEHSDKLHFEKNRPSPPGGEIASVFQPKAAPYEFRPYPAAIYGPWTDERKRNELLQVARLHQLDLTKPLEREKAESLIYEWDTRTVGSDQERQHWLDRGWACEPTAVKAAQNAWLDRIALDAAHRAHDDQRLSPAAKAEFATADAAHGEHHLLDLPVPPKKRGRPKKSEPTPSAA